ncbi:Glycosyl hydrolases family 1, N-terminal conserved site [Sesbania bispinosa]|nr:Glycosyl hydrolases family 1, N-terminal conserved site [Sesbania bispinosa]
MCRSTTQKAAVYGDTLVLLHIISSHSNLRVRGFPTNFLFGTASSSYQFEGAYLSDGKGMSNWDVFAHKPGSIGDGSNGDVAVDQYHRYLEDIDLMEAIKSTATVFNFMGENSTEYASCFNKIFGEVNLAGINYYDRLIDALLLKGIQPFVTLFHFDIPQELEDRYGGWLSPQSQEDFVFLADICFKSFGDRVKYWVTFNEPDLMSHLVTVEVISHHVAALANWKLQILDPILFGKYPKEMEMVLGTILPNFPSNDQVKLKEGLDFHWNLHNRGFYINEVQKKMGGPNGELTPFEWLNVYPQDHLDNLLAAIREGADVRGYFAWSLLDNFEWKFGFSVKFGLYHVDRATFKRTPRLSASWYKHFIAKHKTESIMPTT